MENIKRAAVGDAASVIRNTMRLSDSLKIPRDYIKYLHLKRYDPHEFNKLVNYFHETQIPADKIGKMQWRTRKWVSVDDLAFTSSARISSESIEDALTPDRLDSAFRSASPSTQHRLQAKRRRRMFCLDNFLVDAIADGVHSL